MSSYSVRMGLRRLTEYTSYLKDKETILIRKLILQEKETSLRIYPKYMRI